ncbi:hypothetical protein AGOR_G00166490 [Albula goreensis]|uniref:EGF-like domain-containing protein n=1 Tax=Albula goreensis TaxID=1534307 RepID=A0A8T3CWW5_9TELE|nr:hypothetical protein AGOR_G00166490 [Albula goreensis]
MVQQRTWDPTEFREEGKGLMAEHGDPCGGAEASFCMNGATCYKIPSASTPSCLCAENYSGSRCEKFQLFISSPESTENGLIVAVVITALLIFVVLAVIIFYSCKYKIWRQK